MSRYVIDRQFSKLCVPKTEEEIRELEKSLRRNGFMQPIYVWQGIVIDGHKRLAACRKLKMKIQAQEVAFSSKEEAVIWACKRRLDQLQKGTAAGEYIIGKLLLTEIKVYDATEKERVLLADELGKQVGASQSTIKRYLNYARFIDEIDEDEGLLVDLALSGKIRFGHQTAKKLMQADGLERQRMILNLTRGSMLMGRSKKPEPKRVEKLQPLDLHVKEMPKYDPDTEVKGLIYTLPMWINAMKQMMQRTMMEQVSDEVKGHLRRGLQDLEEQIDTILEVIAK